MKQSRIKQLHSRNNPGLVHGDTIEAVANLDLVETRCNLSGVEAILSNFKAKNDSDPI